FVADFIGDTNLFRGTVESVDSSRLYIVTETGLSIEIEQIKLPGMQLPQQDLRTGASAVVSVRPEKVTLSLYPVNGAVNCFEGRLINAMYLGTHIQYVVKLLSGENVMVRQPKTVESLPDNNTPVY
ncbi:TOBE domain-containing protein, partial [Planktothrix sp.]|uniref:TOBE domain-containing protein n=1 Tax=Planktothrix sp. TaxID=3088171 RepID=UPI0038D4BE25